jgi:hypothetical protein
MVETLRAFTREVNFWEVQNMFYKIAKKYYGEYLLKAREGDKASAEWVEEFKALGQALSFNTGAVLPGD